MAPRTELARKWQSVMQPSAGTQEMQDVQQALPALPDRDHRSSNVMSQAAAAQPGFPLGSRKARRMPFAFSNQGAEKADSPAVAPSGHRDADDIVMWQQTASQQPEIDDESPPPSPHLHQNAEGLQVASEQFHQDWLKQGSVLLQCLTCIANTQVTASRCMCSFHNRHGKPLRSQIESTCKAQIGL